MSNHANEVYESVYECVQIILDALVAHQFSSSDEDLIAAVQIHEVALNMLILSEIQCDEMLNHGSTPEDVFICRSIARTLFYLCNPQISKNMLHYEVKMSTEGLAREINYEGKYKGVPLLNEH